jgi:hypothetical protein
MLDVHILIGLFTNVAVFTTLLLDLGYSVMVELSVVPGFDSDDIKKYHNFRLGLYRSQRLPMHTSGKDIFAQRFIRPPIKNLRQYIAIV